MLRVRVCVQIALYADIKFIGTKAAWLRRRVIERQFVRRSSVFDKYSETANV